MSGRVLNWSIYPWSKFNSPCIIFSIKGRIFLSFLGIFMSNFIQKGTIFFLFFFERKTMYFTLLIWINKMSFLFCIFFFYCINEKVYREIGLFLVSFEFNSFDLFVFGNFVYKFFVFLIYKICLYERKLRLNLIKVNWICNLNVQ